MNYQRKTESAEIPAASVSYESPREPLSWRQRLWKTSWPNWITRDMMLLLVARICMSTTRAMAGIVVPIYLAVIGFQGVMLGLLFTVTALTSALLTGLIGLLADRFGRKPFLVVIPWLAAGASVAFAFSPTAGVLFVCAALGSFGRGSGAGAGTIGPYQPAEQAFLADAVPARHRNSLFGRIAFASSLGALLGGGPLIALAILLSAQQTRVAYQLEFLLGAGLALLAGVLALPLREAHRPTVSRKTAPQVQVSASVRHRGPRLGLSSASWSLLLRLWITNSVNGLAVGFFGPFITYWFYRRYGAGPAEVGWLYTIINLAAMIANLGAARVAARLGLVRAIVLSRSFQALLIIPMVLAPTFWFAGMLYLLRMLVQRLGLPLRQSFVMGVVPSEERGRIGALSNLPSQATSALSPTLAGYLFDHVALALPFDLGALLQAVNTILFFLFFRKVLPPEEQHPAAKPSQKIGKPLQ